MKRFQKFDTIEVEDPIKIFLAGAKFREKHWITQLKYQLCSNNVIIIAYKAKIYNIFYEVQVWTYYVFKYIF